MHIRTNIGEKQWFSTGMILSHRRRIAIFSGHKLGRALLPVRGRSPQRGGLRCIEHPETKHHLPHSVHTAEAEESY